MKLLGIALTKPSFNELTASAVMAAGLWMAAVGLWRASGAPMNAVDAGAALVVIAWSCVCARMGIRIDRGPKHLALNLGCSALLLALYQAAITLFG